MGGDTDDAVLSVNELIQIDQDGAVDRGAKVIESATLMVMEMKETEVTKTLTVLKRCCVEEGTGESRWTGMRGSNIR